MIAYIHMLFWEFDCQLLRPTAKIFGPFTAYGKPHRDSVLAYSLCCLVGRRHVVSNHHDILK